MSLKVNLSFTSIINRHDINIAEQSTRKIANKYGLTYSKYLSDFSVLSLNRLSLEELIVANNVIVWLWILDKVVDSNENITLVTVELNHIVDVLRYNKAPQTPIAQMIRDPEFWGNYYNTKVVAAIIDMIEYGMRVKLRILNRSITLDEYVNVRMYDSGCFVLLSLLHTNSEDTQIANIIMWMINDIYSYNLDIEENGKFNYIIQLASHYHVSTDIARDIAIKLTYRLSTRIQDEDIKACCYGCLLWHDNSPRYK